MSLHIGILYHWAPKRHRESILKSGLEACRPSRLTPAAFAYVCLATTPSSAWGLVLEPEVEEDGWDLWQVQVREGDPIKVLSEFSPFIREVRVLRTLPADRVWFVGERLLYAHEGMLEPRPKRAKRKTRRK